MNFLLIGFGYCLQWSSSVSIVNIQFAQDIWPTHEHKMSKMPMRP